VTGATKAQAPPAGPGSRGAAALFVGVQFALIAALVAIPNGSSWTLRGPAAWLALAAQVAGALVMVVAALGLGRGLTPMPLPNERTRLRTTGPYRWVRHPIYSGLLAFTAALAAGSGSLGAVGLVAVLAAVLTAKARWEETYLCRTFDGYAQYAETTGRFVPPLRRHLCRVPRRLSH